MDKLTLEEVGAVSAKRFWKKYRVWTWVLLVGFLVGALLVVFSLISTGLVSESTYVLGNSTVVTGHSEVVLDGETMALLSSSYEGLSVKGGVLLGVGLPILLIASGALVYLGVKETDFRKKSKQTFHEDGNFLDA